MRKRAIELVATWHGCSQLIDNKPLTVEEAHDLIYGIIGDIEIAAVEE